MVNDIITEEHGKRLIADEGTGAQNRISQTAHILLADVVDIDIGRLTQDVEKILPPLTQELVLECRRGVKMILDGAFPMTADDQNFLDTACQGFLHNILDGRLIDNGQHLLRCRFCRRKKSCSISCCRNNRFSYLLCHDYTLHPYK